MNRVDRRRYLHRLERAHLEMGRAYEQVLQLRISCPYGSPGGDRLDAAVRRLHKVESKIQTIRAEMLEHELDDREQKSA